MSGSLTHFADKIRGFRTWPSCICNLKGWAMRALADDWTLEERPCCECVAMWQCYSYARRKPICAMAISWKITLPTGAS